jgi:hypothetical protein
MPTPSSSTPKLEQLLKGLSVPLALSLAVTMFSGNNLSLFNNWFNGSFNRITPMLQGDTDLTGRQDPELLPTPSVSIQVDAGVTLPEQDVQRWRQFAGRNDRPLDLTPSEPPAAVNQPQLDLPGALAVPNPATVGPQSLHQILPPLNTDQWFTTRSTYPSLSLVVFGADDGVGGFGGWGRSPNAVDPLLTSTQGSEPGTGPSILGETPGASSPGEAPPQQTDSCITYLVPFNHPESSGETVPEPGMVVAIAALGAVMLGHSWG